MSRVRGKDTKPEKIVRSALFRSGLRFRLHDPALPGKPDVILPKYGAVVFVHGCFWHRHPGCRRATTPASNLAYWTRKFERNVERDKQEIAALEQAGWRVFVVWECEMKRPGFLEELAERIRGLSPQGRDGRLVSKETKKRRFPKKKSGAANR